MTALPAVVFYWKIMHYQPHHDNPFSGFVFIACVIGGVILLIRAIKRKQTIITVLYSFAIISGVFFLYWTTRIPLCLECEPMSKKDLGFMLEPFAERFGDYWPD